MIPQLSVSELQGLTGLTEAQISTILYGILSREQQKYRNANTIFEMQVINMSNPMSGTINGVDMLKIQALIEKLTKISLQVQLVAPDVANGMAASISDSSKRYFERYGNDIKTGINNILQDGIKRGLNQSVIAGQIDDIFNQQIGIKEIKGRGLMIARTETMRAAHLSNWYGAKQQGATVFKVISRSTACIRCRQQYGMGSKIFSMDQISLLPPLHPYCRCIPMFFKDKKEANSFKEV